MIVRIGLIILSSILNPAATCASAGMIIIASTVPTISNKSSNPRIFSSNPPSVCLISSIFPLISIESKNPEIVSWKIPNNSVKKSRNDSLFCHSNAIAPVIAAIAATISSIGPNAIPAPPAAAAPAPSAAVPIPASIPVNLEPTPIIADIPVDTLPIPISNGDRIATNPKIPRSIFC